MGENCWQIKRRRRVRPAVYGFVPPRWYLAEVAIPRSRRRALPCMGYARHFADAAPPAAGASQLREEQREAVGNRKRLLFAITLLSPIALLLVVELGLRLLGFGGSYPLFVDAEGMPGYLQANPQVIQRYLSRAPDLGIDIIYFKKQIRLTAIASSSRGARLPPVFRTDAG